MIDLQLRQHRFKTKSVCAFYTSFVIIVRNSSQWTVQGEAKPLIHISSLLQRNKCQWDSAPPCQYRAPFYAVLWSHSVQYSMTSNKPVQFIVTISNTAMFVDISMASQMLPKVGRSLEMCLGPAQVITPDKTYSCGTG